MTFTRERVGDVVTLRIEGELDAVTVLDIRAEMEALILEAPQRVSVDLSVLRLIDSSGIGAIVSLFKRVRTTGGAVTVRGVRGQPLAIFRLLRLDRVLFEETEASAATQPELTGSIVRRPIPAGT